MMSDATQENVSIAISQPVSTNKLDLNGVAQDDENIDTSMGSRMSSFRSLLESIDQEEVKMRASMRCCPNGIEQHSIPLILAFVAFVLTFCGSWVCSYFTGAVTGFTGKNYGLWTLQDNDGKCLPWDILFYSYSLGDYLSAARALSMTAMILGLSLMTAMSQALQCHFVSYGVGVGFFGLWIASLSTSQTFNVWTVFFFFLYIILVLIVRSLFIHPVHREISWRGSKYIASLLILCSLLTILTLLVLNSEFCQCYRLSPATLEGRSDPLHDTCENQCELGPAGITMIFASATWLLSGLAVLKHGVQPEGFTTMHSKQYGGYWTESITTRVDKKIELVRGRLFTQTERFTNSSNSDDPIESVKTCKPEEVGESENVAPFADVQDEDVESDDAEDYASPLPIPAPMTSSERRLAGEQRTWCQKLCCDFRVTERTKREKAEYWCFRVALVALYAIFGFAVVMLVGSRFENGEAERAPSTAPNFITNVTCAFNASNTSAPFVTYNTPEEAAADNMTVAHCGECGDCSNMADIETYFITRQTIAIKAKECGSTSVLGSREELDSCLEERIGFTDACRTCWVDNMLCDAKLCLFSCMKTLFTGYMSSNVNPDAGDQRLNWCLECDERRCGTAFATCSGVARRRLGIESEIERDPAELCPHTAVDWKEHQF